VSTINTYDPKTSEEIFFYFQNDFSVSVRVKGDDSALLIWTDGINDWVEEYDRLSYAFARLALLQTCAESKWEKAFASNPETFVRQFDGFVLGTTG
jgi:hypothetical protein